MAKRLGLSLSPAMPLFTELTFEWQHYDPALCSGGPFDTSRLTAPPEGVVRFVEWDEVYGRPGDASSGVTTDGWGRISLDLALRVPKIENGRLMEDNAYAYDPEQQAMQGSAPFAMQGRMWIHGNVAKGVWSVDPFLPDRTVLIGREKQLKVKGEPDCAAAKHGIPSFEVCKGIPCSAGVMSAPLLRPAPLWLPSSAFTCDHAPWCPSARSPMNTKRPIAQVLRTYERPKVAHTGLYNLPLLDHAVGDANRNEFRRLILGLQAKKKMIADELSGRNVRQQRSDLVAKLEEKLRRSGGHNADTSVAKLLSDGFKVESEPYLQLQLAKLHEAELTALKKGKLLLPGASGSDEVASPLLVGIVDPTNSLEASQVAPYVNGTCVPRPAGLDADAPFEALAYRDPGMHPGDIRKVQVAYPPALTQLMAAFEERSRELSRVNAVFFSAKGDPRHSHRSLADMLAGGDYDGDQYQIILWQELVKLFANESPPYDPDAPLPPLLEDPPPKWPPTGSEAAAGARRSGRKGGSASSVHTGPCAHTGRPQPPPQCKCDLCRQTKKQQAAREETKRKAEAEKAQARQAAAAAEKAEAEKAAAAGRSSRGKQQLLLQAAEKERTAAVEAERAQRERATQRALLSNYLMARFLGSPMVGSSATHHMIFADKYATSGGVAHPACLHMNHEYSQALDAEGLEELTIHTHRRLPAQLRALGSEFPAHMKDKYDLRMKRSGARTVKLVEPKGSLLGELWQLNCTVPADALSLKLLDPHLLPEWWAPNALDDQREREKLEMRGLYDRYARRVGECLSSSVEEGWSDEDWARYDALINDCKQELQGSLTDDELVDETPKWFYARVGALYQVCYELAQQRLRASRNAQQQQQQQREQRAAQVQSQADGTAGTASAPSSGVGGSGAGSGSDTREGHPMQSSWAAPIKFPWRIAADHLMEMKMKGLRRERLMKHKQENSYGPSSY